MQKLKKMLFILLLVLTTMFVDAQKQDQYRIGYTTEYRTGSKYVPTGSTYQSKSPKRRSPENPKPEDPPTPYIPFSRTWRDWYNSEGGQDWVRINGSPWGIFNDADEDWPSYVDKDYWDEFLAQYPEYEDEARKWFEEYQQNNGEVHPKDPFTPVGDIPIILILIFCILYAMKKNDTINTF